MGRRKRPVVAPQLPGDPIKGFRCSGCNQRHEFPPYVYAHWDEELTHTCDCGVRHIIVNGTATQED